MWFILWLRHIFMREDHRPQLESGQGLVEYAIILVFVSVLVMVMLLVLGPAVYNMFDTIVTSMLEIS